MWVSKFKNMTIAFFVVAGVLFTISLAHAELPLAESWEIAGPGTLSVTEVTYGVQFSYNLNNTSVWSGQSWELSAVATETTTMDYTWHYSGIHAWFQASAKVTAFVEHNGERTTTVLFDQVVSGNFDGIGGSSFQLVAGDTYGFIINGKNYDSNSFLIGSLEINISPQIQAVITGTPGNNSWYTSNVDLSWTRTYPLSEEISTSGCDPVSITNDTTGNTYTCIVTTLDGTSSQSVIIKRDATAPITTDNSPVGWNYTDVIVNLAASDEGSGVAITNYIVDGSTPQTGTSVSFTSNGTHTLSYWSVDYAGNIEAQHTATIMIDKSELADATFQANSIDPTNQNVTLTITYPAYAEVKQFSTDNQTWIAYMAPIVANENQTVYAKYQNDQGYWSNVSNYVINNIDKEAPTTTTTEMVDNITNYVTVNLFAVDSGSGIAATNYTIDDGAEQTGHTLQLRAEGSHTITYWSVDVAGNMEDVQSLIVEVELLPIGVDGQFNIGDLISWIEQGTLQQIDLNDDGIFNASDIRIMLLAISPFNSASE